LHRFRDIAFERSKFATFGYPSCVYPSPDGGFPCTIAVKFSVKVSGWLRHQMAYEHCRKLQSPE